MRSNPLISDRIPFLLFERCRIYVEGGSLVAMRKEEIKNIPVRNLHLLILGNGVSITSEAMSVCSKHSCYIAQSKGGSNIHTTHHAGAYKNPQKLIKQVLKSQNPEQRLATAKYILTPKIAYTESFTENNIKETLFSSKSIEEILGIESYASKIIYKNIFGPNFIRYKESPINKNINIGNSVLYNLVASIVVCLGYSPSIGFVHGHTRRGALVFDIADMFKHRLVLSLAKTEGNMARDLFSKCTEHNNKIVKEMIKEIETVCSL